MDLRFVDTLIVAVEEGSLAAAARRQGITAAAVAQRIAALEAELNVSLLVRDGRRMAPTPDCRTLLPDLRHLVALGAGLPGRLSQDRLSGRLRLGAVSTALGDFGPGLVRALEQAAPEVALSVIPAGSKEIFGQFEAGALDAALVVAPPFALPKTMVFERLARQEIGHLHKAGMSATAPYLVYSRAAWGGAACWRALQAHAPDPHILCEMDAVEIIGQMVADGLGQAVLPRWGGLERHHGDLVFDSLADASRDIGLLTCRRDAGRPLVALLRKTLGQLAKAASRN